MRDKTGSLKWFLITSLLALLLILPACTSAGSSYAYQINQQQEGIWVTGTGKVTVVPDIATVSLGIQAQDTTVAAAQTQAADAMNRVIATLKSNGITDKDIQTQSYSIQQVTRYDQNTQQSIPVGYVVSNFVNAKIRDIAKTGAIIDAVAQAGGNFTRFNSVSFGVDNPAQFNGPAREAAVADAKARADQLAKLAGVTLGKPTYISESTQSIVPPYPITAVPAPAPSVPTPISPGQTDIIVNVTIAYAIAQ